MYQQTHPFFLICEYALQAGSGKEGGIIDNPIQREEHTGFPKVDGGGIKGAMRDVSRRYVKKQAQENKDDKSGESELKLSFEISNDTIDVLFGPDDDIVVKEGEGAIGFPEARLLLFPVKSVKGVFTWITCPFVIERFVKDLNLNISDHKFRIEGLEDPGEEEIHSCGECNILFSDEKKENEEISQQYVILEQFPFLNISKNVNLVLDDKPPKLLSEWLSEILYNDLKYWKVKLAKNMLIVNNDAFSTFVQRSTEVHQRNKIDPETGTAEDGKLFSEEYLPCESVLYCMLGFNNEFSVHEESRMTHDKILNALEIILGSQKNVFKLGGNSTVGKGVIRSKLFKIL